VSQNVAHYRVYRRTSAGNVLVATVGPVSSCTVSGLARRTTYNFFVTAVHTGGQESFVSNVVSVRTQ
jgi:chitin-binding protein